MSSSLRQRITISAASRKEYSTDDDEPTSPLHREDSTGDLLQKKVSSSESKLRKIATRTVFGFGMIFLFLGIIYAGHLYVCMLVVALQALVFKEMVNVRYVKAKEREIPLFRTLQWSWFVVATFYTYGDFLHGFCLQHEPLLWLAAVTKFHSAFSFGLYCTVFVVSVLTLKKGLYRYQVGQLTWTIVTICMIVAQLKFVAHNIFSGLFWFFFPCSLVIANDCFAYFCGMSFGRRFIKAPFLRISPNKTWEGFLGAMVLTWVYAWMSSRWLSRSEWFACPVDDLNLIPRALHCQVDTIFQVRELTVPPSVEHFARSFLLLEPPLPTLMAAPIQLHALVMATFTSVIAPFGGFWASAIKRAYGIKDFDSIIPGHGGVTDRMDCQFITALFVSVYRDTFLGRSMVSVGGLLASASLLTPEERLELHRQLGRVIAAGTSGKYGGGAGIGTGGAAAAAVATAGGAVGAAAMAATGLAAQAAAG